ncbi:MAG: aminotransferase class I and II [Labilithrix sp.]|nr:aminotransferase class I and II [Labilithrix sp.]MBX3217902.1 aminotransferase class I and II [Labilithrix sp.]
MRTVRAVRYVLPFRQGGSVPALVEADDLGLYVVKLRGAGQGHKTLIAELVAGELARAAGLHVPELVLVELDAKLSESEPDPELARPLEASAGLNLGLDYLPGSITFDPAARFAPDATTASRLVVFDALVTNVDRTARNANLLQWHRRLWLIDHGAALYFHHGWGPADRLEGTRDVFVESASHVLLRWASELDEAAAHLTRVLTEALVERVVAEIPDAWLDPGDGFTDVAEHRAAYAAWLQARAQAMPAYLAEAKEARARLV